MFEHQETKRRSNLNPQLVRSLVLGYEKKPTPEEIFYYIYSTLYSDIYHTKYADFLKMDFPRIAFTKHYELFGKMAEYGRRLVDLHLLKSTEPDLPIVRFQAKGEYRAKN